MSVSSGRLLFALPFEATDRMLGRRSFKRLVSIATAPATKKLTMKSNVF
jgi:hypothetical protein